jgi:hypothetical protein
VCVWLLRLLKDRTRFGFEFLVVVHLLQFWVSPAAVGGCFSADGYRRFHLCDSPSSSLPPPLPSPNAAKASKWLQSGVQRWWSQLFCPMLTFSCVVAVAGCRVAKRKVMCQSTCADCAPQVMVSINAPSPALLCHTNTTHTAAAFLPCVSCCFTDLSCYSSQLQHNQARSGCACLLGAGQGAHQCTQCSTIGTIGQEGGQQQRVRCELGPLIFQTGPGLCGCVFGLNGAGCNIQ